MKYTVTELILRALESAQGAGELSPGDMPQVIVEIPKEGGHGDFACTVALTMAKQQKKPPRQIAETIKRHVKDDGGMLDRVEIAGPGFLNFFIRPQAWTGVLADVERQGRSYGHTHVGHGKKVLVEFVT